MGKPAIDRSPTIPAAARTAPAPRLPPPSEPSEEEETSEEEVDSDSSPFRADSRDPLAGGEDSVTWMPEGDMERMGRIAYIYINVDGLSDNPAPFIRAALFAAAPTVYCQLLPSSRGNMMLRFNNRADHDGVVGLSPIIHDGARLTLEWAEETSNRFVIQQRWLVAVSAVDFPEEHWDPARIVAGFRKLGTVVEIDPACLGNDHSVLRVVVARGTAMGIDHDQNLGNPSQGSRGESLGTAFTIEVLRIWRREE